MRPCVHPSSTKWIYHILLIHSSVNRLLGGFHIFTTVNNGAMSMGLWISLQNPVFNYCGSIPRNQIARLLMIIIFLIFEEVEGYWAKIILEVNEFSAFCYIYLSSFHLTLPSSPYPVAEINTMGENRKTEMNHMLSECTFIAIPWVLICNEIVLFFFMGGLFIFSNFISLFTNLFIWLSWVFVACPSSSLVSVPKLLILVASLVEEHRLQGVWAQ